MTVPRLDAIECEVTPYSMLGRPAWVDRLAQRLRDAAELRVRVKVQGERSRVLGLSVRRITQRVNLFERILIPNVKQNIKRIQIFLGDLDREAVIRSKLSKGKHGEAAYRSATRPRKESAREPGAIVQAEDDRPAGRESRRACRPTGPGLPHAHAPENHGRRPGHRPAPSGLRVAHISAELPPASPTGER